MHAKNTLVVLSIYSKKLFSLKNLIFFVFSFFLFWTLYASIISIAEHNYEQDPAHHTLIIDQWRMRICIYGIYSAFIINYSYLFLKKNNFKQVDNLKNTTSNTIVTFFLFILIWGIFSGIMLNQMQPYKYDSNGLMKYDYKIMLYLMIMMISYSFISLLVLSLIVENVKNVEKYTNFYYIFLVFVVIFQFIFFIFILKNLASLSNNDTLDKFNLISKSLILTTIILLFLNIVNRLIRRRYYKK